MPAPSRHRGPEFLPYPLPAARHTPPGQDRPTPPADDPGPAAGRRWLTAEIILATIAVLALALLSLALGWRRPGAVTAVAAASAGVIVAVRRRLVRTSELVGVAAAVAALLLLLPGTPPAPAAAAPQVVLEPPTPSAQAGPDPLQVPPSDTAIPGVPTEPGPPLASAPTASGLLVGRVLDRSGQPVPGAVVVVTRARPGDVSEAPRCPLRLRTTSDATGAYRLSLCQLADGLAYAVRISVAGDAATANLFVNAGRTTVYNVILDLRHA